MISLSRSERRRTTIQRINHVPSVAVQWGDALASLRLAFPHCGGSFDHVDVAPTQSLDLLRENATKDIDIGVPVDRARGC
jgi:hypothetical protein